MATQASVDVRNGRANSVETVVGVSPTLELRSGDPPANCAAADSGTLLAELALPSDWMAPAANGAKAMSGSWSDPAANAAGVIGHFRIKQSTTCHLQGTVTITGGGGDLTVDNPNVAIGQVITVTAFGWTEPNA